MLKDQVALSRKLELVERIFDKEMYRKGPSRKPVVDELTRKLTAAWRERKVVEKWGRTRRISCIPCPEKIVGDFSDYSIADGRFVTNALCIHRLAYHRAEMSERDLAIVSDFDYGEESPTREELKPKMVPSIPANAPLKDLLYLQPTSGISEEPIVDHITRKMTTAFRLGVVTEIWCGIHECSCGASSSSRDYAIAGGLYQTNSLCVHYLAYHRHEIPPAVLKVVADFDCEEAEPTEQELGRVTMNTSAPSPFGESLF